MNYELGIMNEDAWYLFGNFFDHQANFFGYENIMQQRVRARGAI